MNFKYHICLALAFGLIVSSCGPDTSKSKLSRVSDPSDQVIGSVREYWIYENISDGLGRAEIGSIDSLHTNFFPVDLPMGEENIFWVSNSPELSLSNVEFSISHDPEIKREVPVFKAAKLSNGYLELILHSDSFASIMEHQGWELTIEPTFFLTTYTDAQSLDIVRLGFEISTVCLLESDLSIDNLDDLIESNVSSRRN